MAETIYTDNVVIDGTQDETQLDVQGHSTQTSPLQTWKDSSGTVLAEVLGDGRIHAGDDLGSETEDAFIEVHREEDSTRPQLRGLNMLGRITNAVPNVIDTVQWAVQELELWGTGVMQGTVAAVRARLTNKNTATSTAELRAGEFSVRNEAGSVDKVVGLRSGIENTGSAQISEAVGLEVEVADDSSVPISNVIGIKVGNVGEGNIALQTGTGIVHFGDAVGINIAQPDASAILDIQSSDKGVLLPRMTEQDRDNISSAANGLIVYNTTTQKLDVYDGSNWVEVGNNDWQNPGAIDTVQLVDLAVTEVKIADGAVTNAKLGTDAVTGINIQDSAVTTPKINNLAITTGKIADDAVTLDKLAGGTANRFFATDGSGNPSLNLLAATDIPNLDASKITSGTLSTARIPSLDASKITTGTLSTALIPNLDASKIASGTLSTARIPSLDATKITSGVFANARISWAAPGTIGNTTPQPGTFTDLTANRFYTTGSQRWSMYNISGWLYMEMNGAGNRFQFGQYTLAPSAANIDLGASWAKYGSVWANNGTIQTSDVRHKDILSVADEDASDPEFPMPGLDLISRLNPVMYRWKDYSETYTEVDGTTRTENYTFKRAHAGLIAQEVKEVLGELGIDFGLYVESFDSLDENDEPITYALRYSELIPVIIKSVQEQQAKIAALEKVIAALS